MKAILFRRYGPPESLQIEEVKKPKPGKRDLLIKVHASTITSGVAIIRQSELFILRLINGPFKPILWKILGIEFSGIVEEVGQKVSRFKEGDEVFGSTGFRLGTFAEYVCLNEKKAVAPKPENLSWEEAAVLPVGAYTSIYFLREKAQIKSNQKVLIYGASGSVGSYAVQLAKYIGSKVTGVASTGNLELVTSIGADEVIDYTSETASQEYGTYDIIFDAVGKTESRMWKKHLSPKGKFVSVNQGLARGKPEYIAQIGDLAASGAIKPVIDKIFVMEDIAEAFRYVEEGHKRGNVVIKII